MVDNITNYIRSLNFKYNGSLIDQGIEYFNAKGSFVDEHTVHVMALAKICRGRCLHRDRDGRASVDPVRTVRSCEV